MKVVNGGVFIIFVLMNSLNAMGSSDATYAGSPSYLLLYSFFSISPISSEQDLVAPEESVSFPGVSLSPIVPVWSPLLTPQGCVIGRIDHVSGGVFWDKGRKFGFLNAEKTGIIDFRRRLIYLIIWDSYAVCWRIVRPYIELFNYNFIRSAPLVEHGREIGFIDHDRWGVFSLQGKLYGRVNAEKTVVVDFFGRLLYFIEWDGIYFCWHVIYPSGLGSDKDDEDRVVRAIKEDEDEDRELDELLQQIKMFVVSDSD